MRDDANKAFTLASTGWRTDGGRGVLTSHLQDAARVANGLPRRSEYEGVAAVDLLGLEVSKSAA